MKSRVHPKYKTKYHVGNWPEYERALVRRGDITLWLSADAIDAWTPRPSGRRGGQRKFSDQAIETALTLRLVFGFPLRQAEGFLRSVLSVMRVDLDTPDHTTLSRHRVSAEQRQVRRQLRVRDLLVRTRGRTIAHMRALVRSEGLRVRAGDADRFGTYVRDLELPAELQAMLRPLVTLWEQLTAQLAAADAQVIATAAANPVVQRLTTAPGVGPLIATAFVATLDEAGRFGGAHQVASYLGLVPSEASSADRRRRGHITKAGNPRMRWLLVQAAWAALRSHRAEGAGLRAWADQLATRRGRRIATVAVARRLAGILFAMWRDQTTCSTAPASAPRCRYGRGGKSPSMLTGR